MPYDRKEADKLRAQKKRLENPNFDKEYYQRNKEKLKNQQKEYRKNNYKKLREASLLWKEKNPNYRKEYSQSIAGKLARRRQKLKAAFGITLEFYNELLAKQNGVCAICHNPERIIHPSTKEVKALCVDHCHSSGVIRGLLCFDCNTAVGKLGDDLEKSKKVVDYLTPNS